jgi:histidine decarboxylase
MKNNQKKALSLQEEQRLDQLYDKIEYEYEHFLGYPCNGIFDYTPLYRFLNYPINNVGDPFLPSNYHLNTHEFECEVLSIFSELTQAPSDSTWGYITNGGTEGNMYGIFLARELFPDGIVYYSEDTHYSVDKILRCLHIRSIMIKSQGDGTMDLDDLRETIKIHRDVPPIIFANVGTTMKGAVDDLAGIRQIFRDIALQRHYIHVDAALGGMILPFIDDAPPWNFNAGVDSISISGHKMIGSPIPCGVVLAKKANVDRIAQSVEYIGTLDTTMSGSRNGITPLFLWYSFRLIGIDGFREQIQQCLEVADYAVAQLNKIGRNAWRHKYSNTVVFDRPSLEVTSKWQLAPNQNITHLLTMPHVTRERIDLLVADIVKSEEKQKILPLVSASANGHIIRAEGEGIPLKQITIVSPSNPNVLADISKAMAGAGINIESLSADSLGDMEVIRMTVDDYDKALQILSHTSYSGRLYGQPNVKIDSEALGILHQMELQPMSEDAVLVQIEEQPGALAALTRRFLEAHLKPRSIRIIRRADGKVIVAIASEETEKARSLLQDLIISVG